jgi:hypothetical protein
VVVKRPTVISLCFLMVAIGLSYLVIGKAFSLDTNYCQSYRGCSSLAGLFMVMPHIFKGSPFTSAVCSIHFTRDMLPSIRLAIQP